MWNEQLLVGKSRAEAVHEAHQHFYNVRVLDETIGAITCEYNSERLNLEVENDIVIRVYIG